MRISKRILLTLMALFLLIGLVGCSNNDEEANDQPPVEEQEDDTEEGTEEDLESKYLHALEVGETDKVEGINLLFELGDYKDSREKITEFKYERAQELYEDEEYDEAYQIFVGLGSYEDSEDMALEIRPLRSNQ